MVKCMAGAARRQVIREATTGGPNHLTRHFTLGGLSAAGRAVAEAGSK